MSHSPCLDDPPPCVTALGILCTRGASEHKKCTHSTRPKHRVHMKGSPKKCSQQDTQSGVWQDNRKSVGTASSFASDVVGEETRSTSGKKVCRASVLTPSRKEDADSLDTCTASVTQRASITSRIS